MSKEVSVLVIGAGISGISCAHRLIEGGFTDVLVLEASNRWGGRVNTVVFGDAFVELGANWIHGGSLANPVFQLANRKPGLLEQEGSGQQVKRLNRRKGFFYRPGGRCIEKDLGERAYDAFIKFKEEMGEAFENPEVTSEDTLSYADRKYREIVDTFPPAERSQVEAVLWGMVNYVKFHFGDDLQFCNAKLYGSYWDMPGGDVILPGGYRNVFTHLHEAVGDDRIRYGKEVTKVIHGEGRRKNVVKCSDGTEFLADHVVVTVPLGYLKKHHQELFEPALLAEKVEAIENIGFGRTGKIFLEFEYPFWAKGEEVIKIAWGKDAITNEKMPEEWYKSIMGFEEVTNNRKVLVAWIGGRGAAIMETLSDEEVTSQLTALLRSCTGNDCLPRPKRILRTKWIHNPFSLGSYSYGGMKSDVPRNQNDLARPMLDGETSVRFAGEATHPFAYSTVHGAYLTGIREANSILQSI